jgi:TetR/AcrR family transcriptional repressor of nem operon
LARDSLSLPEPVLCALRAYYVLNETWIAGLLERAQVEHGHRLASAPMTVARVVFSGLQNAKVAARLFGDTGRVRAVADLLMAATGQGSSRPHQATLQGEVSEA